MQLAPDATGVDAPPPPEGGPERAWFAELNRTRLRVWEWGDPDAPPVVCVHGAYDHGRMFDGLAPRIATLGYRVLALDLRGHGDSGRLAHGHTWLVTALDLALLARLLGGPVGWVGHSMGAGHVTYAANVWPELARWVVNIDGLGPDFEGHDDDDERPFAQAAAENLDWNAKVLLGPPRVWASRDDMAARRAAVNVRLPAAWVEHLVRHGAVEVEGGWVWKADPAFRSGLGGGDWSPEHLYAEQAGVACPVLVLTGTEEDSWTLRDGAEIARRVAGMGARHVVVEGTGHYVHVERPDAVAAAIAAFTAEVGP